MTMITTITLLNLLLNIVIIYLLTKKEDKKKINTIEAQKKEIAVEKQTKPQGCFVIKKKQKTAWDKIMQEAWKK